jgi:hypothetical protein
MNEARPATPEELATLRDTVRVIESPPLTKIVTAEKKNRRKRNKYKLK